MAPYFAHEYTKTLCAASSRESTYTTTGQNPHLSRSFPSHLCILWTDYDLATNPLHLTTFHIGTRLCGAGWLYLAAPQPRRSHGALCPHLCRDAVGDVLRYANGQRRSQPQTVVALHPVYRRSLRPRTLVEFFPLLHRPGCLAAHSPLFASYFPSAHTACALDQ